MNMRDPQPMPAVQARHAEDTTMHDPFAAGAIECVIATTEQQREVWLGCQLGVEASLAYNESVTLHMHGPLDRRALAAAMDQLVARHQSLRATISPDGNHMLVSEPRMPTLAERDLSALAADARRQAVAQAHTAAVRTPFVLEQGPLFHATLFQLDAAEHELVLCAHHIVCDGWSWAVIVEELGQLYGAQAHAQPDIGPMPEAAPAYADFAAFEAAAATSPDMQQHVAYWLSLFAGRSLPVLELPLDHPRPAVRTFNADRIDRMLDATLVTGMRALAARSGASLFAGMLGAFATTLHRLSGQDDVVVGVPAAAQAASDMPGLVGHCVHLLPLRIDVRAEQTFEALMQHTGGLLLDAFEHQALGYGSLLQQLPVHRDAARLPLVSVMFNLDPEIRTDPRHFEGLVIAQSTIPRPYENFELFLNVTPAPGGMRMEAQYNTDLFDAPSIQRWLDMFECVLRSALRRPAETLGRLDVLPPSAAIALRALQPAPTPLIGAPFMHAAFVARARMHPERIAVSDAAGSHSYHALDALSNRMAYALRARGVGRGHYVGLCLERGIDMLVALLAILKAGGTYVPLDPGFPKGRLEQYAEDAALALLVTSSDLAAAPRAWCADAPARVFEIDRDAWRAHPATAMPADPRDAQPDDAAYIIYTSGSTGRPKGVRVPHRGVANLLQTMQDAPGIGAEDRIAAVTTLSFDIAVVELVLPLAAGAQTVIVAREVAMDGRRLGALLQAEAITILQATPGTWRLLIDAQWTGSTGFRAWIGGEPVPARLAVELLERSTELWNLYGPTETTVWSTVCRLRRDAIAARGVSIGQPVANTEVWILDANLQPCPVGVPGEICIGGTGVTLGYLDRAELTAERFVTVDVLGSPKFVYRTGDRGRWRNDGQMEHLGRFDFQLKVRGYRIEPGEIEARCNEAQGVARSVVVAREDQPGDLRLVAYLALTPGGTFDATALQALQAHLRDTLPGYMVPQHIVPMAQLPLLPNGKIDRNALPAPQATAASNATHQPPRNACERTVLAAMERVLSLPGMGIHDDFFAMGGHSLLAARLAALLSQAFDITVPLRTLFEAPTAEQLAQAVEALQGAGATARIPISYQLGRRTAILTPAQERIRFVEALHPGRSVYNAPSAQRLIGPFELRHLDTALRAVVRRQNALRTQIGLDPATGRPEQQVLDAVSFELPLVDLRALPEDQRESELADRLQSLADQPIDITRAPLFHAAVYQVGDEEHVFAFVPHHIVWDGWSSVLLWRELFALYNAAAQGVPHGLPPLTLAHGDYADWLAEWMTQPTYEAQLAFWKTRFAHAPTPRALRTDMPRRSGMSGEGGAQRIDIDRATTARLRELARSFGVTINMLTFGLYALTLGSVIGSHSVIIATPVRGREAPETEDVMGFFNNVLPISVEIDATLTLADFMRYVKHELLSLMSYQQVPFERLVVEPEFHNHARGTGLYQSMFSFEDVREHASTVGAMKCEPVDMTQRGATDDIGVWLMDKAGGLDGALVYNADIFLRETGAQLRDRYVEVLERALDMPLATLGVIGSPDGSPSARYLQKLAAVQPGAETTPAAVKPPSPPAKNLEMLLAPEQAQLAQIWASVMDIDVHDIRATDNFFDLGGDSLLAMRAIQQAEHSLGHRVEARRYLFETLGQIALTARHRPPVSPTVESIDALVTMRPSAVRGAGLLGRVFGGWNRKG